MVSKFKIYSAGLLLLILNLNCKKDGVCPEESDILDSFTTEDGITGFVTTDGKAYIEDNNGCNFYVQYFNPGYDSIYVFTDSGIYINTEDGPFPVSNNFFEDFENYEQFIDIITMSITDTNLYWNSFTLQSPLAPEIQDYVDLRNCILAGTCGFLDNTIQIITDPTNDLNKVIQFYSVASTGNMITAKCSIDKQSNYFVKGMNLWYEAKYYIVNGMPYSLVDFENSYFDQSPGPRVVIEDNKLAIENKFAEKITYYPTSGLAVPTNQWFTVKVHFYLSDEQDGIIEMWQDGNLILSTTGINIPLSISIQNSLELGISATDIGATLLVDDVRLSEFPF